MCGVCPLEYLMQVWIIGKSVRDCEDGQVWEFGGVFGSREKAEGACLNVNYFCAPAIIDEIIPDGKEPWPECYRPNVSPA